MTVVHAATAVPPGHREEVLASARKAARQLSLQSPALQAELVRVVQESVDLYSRTHTLAPSAQRELSLDIIGDLLGDTRLGLLLTAESKLAAQRSATALSDAASIFNEEAVVFQGFTRASIEALPVTALKAAKGNERLATQAGVLRGVNAWFAREISRTVQGPDAPSVGDSTSVRARRYMMPAKTLIALAPSNEDNPILREAIANTARGIEDALAGIQQVLAPSSSPPLTSTEPPAPLPPQVVSAYHQLGVQLSEYRQYVDHGKQAPAGKFRELLGCMEQVHQSYLRARGDKVEPRYRRAFHELGPEDQSRNIPSMLGAIQGALSADRLVRDAMEEGALLEDGSPSEAGFLLQFQLVAAANRAVGMSLEDGNRTFSQTVTDVDALLLAHRHRAPEQLPAIWHALNNAMKEAARAYGPGGEGVEAAPRIALNAMPGILQAAHPKGSSTLETLQAEVRSVLRRARLEDIGEVYRRDFHGPRCPEGSELESALRASVSPKDYFAPRLDSLPLRQEGDVPLNERELAILSDCVLVAHSTWVLGPFNTAKKTGDYGRLDPGERSQVFNPYDLCVTASSTPVLNLWMIAKDLFVLQKEIAREDARRDEHREVP